MNKDSIFSIHFLEPHQRIIFIDLFPMITTPFNIVCGCVYICVRKYVNGRGWQHVHMWADIISYSSVALVTFEKSFPLQMIYQRIYVILWEYLHVRIYIHVCTSIRYAWSHVREGVYVILCPSFVRLFVHVSLCLDAYGIEFDMLCNYE